MRIAGLNKVYLVGAGPGDPGLITCRGRELLARAGCVLYDHLANKALLALAPAAAERIYVGKKKSDHALDQSQICDLLIDRAKKGLSVVRLKGGDPFIFGRGGEEAEALAAAGILFEIVPGVTAPLGIAAYSGVPLTNREHTSVVTFVTGHNVDSIDWSKVGAAETLVVFMGLTQIRSISKEIVHRGRSPSTPAMVVRWGTYPSQQTITGTLSDIADRIEEAQMKPPATIVIGEVVKLRESLNWFEKLPLFGRRIVVTRAVDQSAQLIAHFQELGAEAIPLPLISLTAPEDPAPLARAITGLDTYDWLIFTSVNGVRFFLDGLDASDRDLRAIRARLCAIGPATKRELEALHLKVDMMPESFVAESLVQSFQGLDMKGKRVLLPRAAAARDVLPENLRALGADVTVVTAYRNVIPEDAAEAAAKIFGQSSKPDWITFTSSSTVTNFLSVTPREALDRVRIASIGPVTSATLRDNGFNPDAEAIEFTGEGLVQAILTFETA
jgi:uroporphyrinogen III methyltransferase/synthase